MASKSRPAGTAKDKFSVLRQHPLFHDLEPSALERLCRYVKSRTVKRGATIFSKGDSGNSLFAVRSGTVKIGVSSSDGRDAIFNLIGAGEMFGEVALLDGRPRTADAIATTDCDLLVIDRREFIPFLQSQPLLAMKFIELLCTRLRWISDHVEQIILPHLSGRLAKALSRLAEKDQARAVNGQLKVTQLELSQMVGMSRESINKQLSIWAKRKWVRLERGGIVVLDKKALEAIAETGSEN